MSRADWILLLITLGLFFVFLFRLSVYERERRIIPLHIDGQQESSDFWYADVSGKLKLDTRIEEENIKGNPRRLLMYMSKWQGVLFSAAEMPRSNLFTLVRHLHTLNEKLKYENSSDCFSGFVAQFMAGNNNAIQAITHYLSSGSVRDYAYMLDTLHHVRNDVGLKFRTCEFGK